MIRLLAVFVICVLGLISAGCGGGASLDQVHEPALLNDKVLQRNVDTELRHAGPELRNVQTRAEDGGTVVLTGSVPTPQAHDRAISVSRSVYGVHQVKDELIVGDNRP